MLYTLTKTSRYRLLVSIKELSNLFIRRFTEIRGSSCQEKNKYVFLTLSWWGPLSYRNQSIDLLWKSMDWFLYHNGLRHERVKFYCDSYSAHLKSFATWDTNSFAKFLWSYIHELLIVIWYLSPHLFEKEFEPYTRFFINN